MAKKRRVISKSPLRALMKKAGAEIVAGDGLEVLRSYLETRVQNLTFGAIRFAKHAKRKKITQRDMQLAIDFLEPKKV